MSLKYPRGFTLVELIAVIVITGVLLTIVSVRFLNINTDIIRAKFDVIAAFQHARQVALSRADTDIAVSVIVSTNSIDVREGAHSMVFSANYYPLQLPLDITVVVGTGMVVFDRLGGTTANIIQLSNGIQIQTITITDGGYAY